MKRGVNISVPLLTVPTICEPLCGQPIIRALNCYCYHSKLDLADNGAHYDSLDVGILPVQTYTGCSLLEGQDKEVD